MTTIYRFDIMWTLEQGIQFARELEKKLIAEGYHCAIGGSVLMSGKSDKDLDIFVYPHKTAIQKSKEYLLEFLRVYCSSVTDHRSHMIYGDAKYVVSANVESKRVDFFFVK